MVFGLVRWYNKLRSIEVKGISEWRILMMMTFEVSVPPRRAHPPCSSQFTLRGNRKEEIAFII